MSASERLSQSMSTQLLVLYRTTSTLLSLLGLDCDLVECEKRDMASMATTGEILSK